MQCCLLLSSILQRKWQKISKEDKEPETDLGPALQDTATQPDELIALNPMLGEEKDQIVLVKEEEQTDLKPGRYVPMVTTKFSTDIFEV